VQIEQWRNVTDLDAGLHAIDIEVLSAGVPYADSYTVLIHVCAKKIADNRTDFGVWAKINYKKQVCVHSLIDGWYVDYRCEDRTNVGDSRGDIGAIR
jgi:hypothetical protein